MPSVVIAAHNEGTVIRQTVEAAMAAASQVEVIVVANGCTDDTVAHAEAAGAVVLNLSQAGKTGALNAGDGAARFYPRVYLDADIVIPPGGLQLMADSMRERGAYVAVPARQVDVRGRPVIVRAYFAISTRLPAYDSGLFGRGLIMLSREGRHRFDRFPDVVADDLFLDSHFAQAERIRVDAVTVTVEAPRTVHALVERLVRVRRGNALLRASSTQVRRAKRWSWLVDVVVPRPWLLPSGLIYAAVTLYAAARARSARGAVSWSQDRTTRSTKGNV